MEKIFKANFEKLHKFYDILFIMLIRRNERNALDNVLMKFE